MTNETVPAQTPPANKKEQRKKKQAEKAKSFATVDEIMDAVADGALDKEEGKALIKAMRSSGGAVSAKVSAKGGVSVSGLGRWPTTLYYGQWKKLIAFVKSGELEKFMEENDDKLSKKDGDPE